MRKILFTLALLISFSSFGQTYDDVIKNNWSEKSVRAFYDNFNRPLKPIEGIYTFNRDTYYKVAIFYYEDSDEYRGFVLETTSTDKNWRKGDKKIELEESSLGGDFDVKWYHPAKRNKKGKIKKNGYYFMADAVADDEGQSIKFVGGNMNSYYKAAGSLIKRYPKR